MLKLLQLDFGTDGAIVINSFHVFKLWRHADSIHPSRWRHADSIHPSRSFSFFATVSSTSALYLRSVASNYNKDNSRISSNTHFIRPVVCVGRSKTYSVVHVECSYTASCTWDISSLTGVTASCPWDISSLSVVHEGRPITYSVVHVARSATYSVVPVGHFITYSFVYVERSITFSVVHKGSLMIYSVMHVGR